MKKTKALYGFTITAVLSLALSLSACQTASQSQSAVEAPLVTVSILPQAFFVERIAGEDLQVNVMVGPGDEPHTYEPTPEQMRMLSKSQVFFSIGVEYEENWITRFQDANPDLVIVDSASGITRISMETHQHNHGDENHQDQDEDDDHDHDSDAEEHHEGSHEHEGEKLDPHVWLSPENGKIIAANVLNTLISIAPEKEADYQKNYKDLIVEIDALDATIESTLSDLPQRTFMVFHPAWGYFANQYDLEQIPVQVGGQEPSPSELIALVDLARAEEISVIFIQPSFDSTSVETIAEEINAEIAVVDPLARNWLENLNTVAEAFGAALGN
jgi:zinc transport system substrate-binding protein